MARGKKLVGEFKDFILRGNVLDLAVAVVVGGAFGLVVSALVKDILTPIVAAIFGQPDFSTLHFTINHSKFLIGDFVNQAIAFLSVAAAVFFVVIKPVNIMLERREKAADGDSDIRPCPDCLSQIPKAATRCAFCTSPVAPIP